MGSRQLTPMRLCPGHPRLGRYATQIAVACISASYGVWIGSLSLNSASFPVKLMVTILSAALHGGAMLVRLVRIGALLPDKHSFEVRHLVLTFAHSHPAATPAQMLSPAVTADNGSRPFPQRVLLTMDLPFIATCLATMTSPRHDQITLSSLDREAIGRDETVLWECSSEGRKRLLRSLAARLSGRRAYFWIVYVGFFGSYLLCAITKTSTENSTINPFKLTISNGFDWGHYT